jgi:hypothetical protein
MRYSLAVPPQNLIRLIGKSHAASAAVRIRVHEVLSAVSTRGTELAT